MTPPPDLRSIVQIAPHIRSGALSPVDLTRACLEQIEAHRHLNAFITVMRDAALADAAALEREIAAGQYRGPLHGIPISIKDLIDVAGTPTTSGSAVPPRHPSCDAPIVARLRNAGAVIVGKTNLHEFAFGTTSDESAFGAVRHPLDALRSPGGSSGGSAVAIVEGMCFASIGTDTGGSVRIPSAACGTVGLKPCSNELPAAGIVPLSTTLDHPGPMARTVADAAAVFHALKGDAPRASLTPAAGQLTLGVPEAYFCERLDPAVRKALTRAREQLAADGHRIQTVVIDDAARTADVYLHICLPEASWFHAQMLEQYPDRYSPGVRLRLEMGRYILAEDYVRAMFLRSVLTRSVDKALDGCDALLLPALAIPAPLAGAVTVDVDGRAESVRSIMLRLTQLFNISGHPAIALPAGTTAEGWPVGVQLVGHSNGTDALLNVAARVEAGLHA
jgi:aspartyl-tRNA(Asn)/glutamyl-tRNA(Gln) amidotransferase subunit A